MVASHHRHFVRHVGVVLALVGLFVPGACARAAGDHYETALTHYNRFEYEQAIIALKNKLQEDADNLPARVLMGNILLKLGHGAAAEETLREARRVGADDVLVLVPLARAYLAQGDHERVLNEISAGKRAPKLAAEILAVRAEAYIARGDLDSAKAEFERAVDIDPLSAAPRVGLARLALLRNVPDVALHHSARAILFDAEDADAWSVDGNARRISGDLEGAIASFGEAVERDPRHAGARLARAALLVDLRREDEANADLDAVLNLNPEHPQAVYLKALLATRAGDFEEAAALLRRSMASLRRIDSAQMQNNAPALLLAGVASNAQGNYEEARAYLERYIAIEPRNVAARRLLATALLNLGAADEAIRALGPVIDRDPDNPELQVMLASALMQQRQFNEASDALRRAIARLPEEANARLRIALAQSELGAGRPRQAVAELEKAIEQDPEATAALLMLGQVHLRQGRAGPALEAAERVLEIEPGHLQARLLRGDARAAAGDFDAAAESYAEALIVERGRNPARFGLAALALRRGDYEAARKQYEGILEEDPRAVRAMIGLARIARVEGHHGDTVRWLEKARSAEPAAVEPHIELIELHLAAGDLPQALDAANDLKTSAPDDARAVEALGRVHIARGDDVTARTELQRVAFLPAPTAPVLVRVATAQLMVEDPEGARASLRVALRKDPGSPTAEAALVAVEVYEKKLGVALERARRLSASRPDLALGPQLAGDVLLRMDRPDEAASAYAEGLDRAQSTALALKLFQSRWSAGRRNEAMDALDAWTKAQPEDLAARDTLAGAHLAMGKLDVAQEMYEGILAERPGNPRVLNSLAWVYQKRGDPRALATIERAYAAAPNDVAALDTYGWILLEEGRPEEALAILRRAESRAAENPWVRYHIALALSKLGRDDEARQTLNALFSAGQPFDGEADARALLGQLGEG